MAQKFHASRLLALAAGAESVGPVRSRARRLPGADRLHLSAVDARWQICPAGLADQGLCHGAGTGVRRLCSERRGVARGR